MFPFFLFYNYSFTVTAADCLTDCTFKNPASKQHRFPVNLFIDAVNHGNGLIKGHVPGKDRTVAVYLRLHGNQKTSVAGSHGNERKHFRPFPVFSQLYPCRFLQASDQSALRLTLIALAEG